MDWICITRLTVSVSFAKKLFQFFARTIFSPFSVLNGTWKYYKCVFFPWSVALWQYLSTLCNFYSLPYRVCACCNGWYAVLGHLSVHLNSCTQHRRKQLNVLPPLIFNPFNFSCMKNLSLALWVIISTPCVLRFLFLASWLLALIIMNNNLGSLQESFGPRTAQSFKMKL